MAMQVKRFFAADMRQAMNRVKEELGADAAILSTRRLAGGVELTAALDYSPQPAAVRANPELEAELRKTSQKILSARTDFEQRARLAAGGRDRQLFDSVMRHTAEMTEGYNQEQTLVFFFLPNIIIIIPIPTAIGA